MYQDSNTTAKISFWTSRKIPLIRQAESSECGLACLAMVAGYYGNQVDITSLRLRFNLSIEGASVHDLMQIASKLNMTSRTIKLELNELQQLKTPCILHWNLNHFVVLVSVSKKYVKVFDPALGEKTYSIPEASQFFTGYALELDPTKDFKVKEKQPSLGLSDFWTKITGLKRSLSLILILSIILQIFALVGPYYIQLIVDDVLVSSDLALLKILAVGFFLLLLFEIVVNFIRGLSILHLSSSMTIQLGANVFHHLIRLPIPYFEKRHLGDIISRFSSLQTIKQLLTTGIVEVMIDGLMVIATLCMLFFYSPLLSSVVLISVFLYALARFAMYRPYKLISEQEIICRAEENSNFMESIRGIQSIKLFSAETDRENAWQNFYAKTINQNIRLGQFEISFVSINKFIFGLENIIVLFLSATLVLGSVFSVGMMFAFVAYKRQFMDKIAKLIDKIIEFKMLSIHFDRLSDIVLTEKELDSSWNNKNVNIEGEIIVENVSFAYSDTSKDVIEDVSFKIFAGESVAIVGPSGCGKSTLLALMLGLQTPKTGSIFIDGQDINSMDISGYRSNVAAVMQKEELFAGTIADNVTFFDSEPNQKLVKKCCQMAAIHSDILKMPMKYETLIGDMGTNLSGGQKQRLILARALYKKPKILFMDEATSHLDVTIESQINFAIKELNITRVIIAHREETISSAERIIDFEKLI
jgi:ATP-binding cassette subfamily B protein RaxB